MKSGYLDGPLKTTTQQFFTINRYVSIIRTLFVFPCFQYLYETAIEFTKLEKVEIGGLKGKMLTQNVMQIFEEFQECFKIFTENTYDNLDYQLPVSSVLSQ